MQFTSLLLLASVATTITISALNIGISIDDSTVSQGISQTPFTTSFSTEFAFKLRAYTEKPYPGAKNFYVGAPEVALESVLELRPDSSSATVFTYIPSPEGVSDIQLLQTKDVDPKTGELLVVSLALSGDDVVLLTDDFSPISVKSIQQNIGNGLQWYIQAANTQDGMFSTEDFSEGSPLILGHDSDPLYVELVPV